MKFRPLRWSSVIITLVLLYSITLQVSPMAPRWLLEKFYVTLHAASWSIVASAINSTSDGSTGPYKAPTGAGTVNTSTADIYICGVSLYLASAQIVANDLTDVSGNTGYTLLTPQTAAGDGASELGIIYKLAPTTSTVEQWTFTHAATTNVGYACLAIKGSDGTTAPTSASSGTTSSTPSAAAVGSAGNIVITAVGNYATGAASIGSSFNIDKNNTYTGGNNMGIAIADSNLVGGVAGSVGPTWTMTAGPTAVEVYNVAFTAGGGGGGPAACKNGLLLFGAGC